MNLRSFSSRVVAVVMVAAVGAPGLSVSRAAETAPPTTEANITRLTTSLLEHSQFAHHPFDRDLAASLLDHYLDALDGSRSLLLQADVNQLAPDGTTLAQATRAAGDTRAARAIFARYLERVQQRAAYVADALKTGAFDFTGHDVYSFDRTHAARPHDLTEAKALWREQLRAEYLEEKLAGKHRTEIVRILTQRYQQQARTTKALRPSEVLEVYLDALAHVYDPHSDYLGREQMESLSIAMNLSLFGIGATLESADGYCKVRNLVPGGPAARSGLLKPGDRISAVAQAGGEPVDIVNMPLSRAVELIRGPKASKVRLTILPANAPIGSPPRVVTLVRDQVKLEDQEARARIVDLPTEKGSTLRVGVIDLPSFYADMGGRDAGAHRSATADVNRLLGKLKAEGVQGVILDLRRNGGGSLQEAISLTGLFIRTGPVVQTRDQAGDVEVGTDPDPAVVYDGPLVVLTSRFTASASEILAGALQDYGRALIVGDSSTFGKGTVQTVVPLARVMDRVGLAHAYDPGALKVTISKFYRPSGASTQLHGVASDIVLPSMSDFGEVSESALTDPLPWDVIPSATYEHLNRVAPHLEALRQMSARRVAAEKDFGYLADEIARVQERVKSKSVSLNEPERSKELATEKALREEQERADQAASATRPATYEITLENVASPGLPPPLVAAKDDASSTAHDRAEPTTGPSTENDIELNETMRILADYVGLLTGRAAQRNP